jgi:peptide/nickel transport system substrate-binding protein
MYTEQGVELDPNKRAATLTRMQQIVHERAMFAPLWQLGFLNGYGPRIKESGFGLIAAHAYSAPYEDITLVDK